MKQILAAIILVPLMLIVVVLKLCGEFAWDAMNWLVEKVEKWTA